jgi:hypothetical protein
VAYDLFGTGKTAVKASLSKYVEQLTYTGTYGDSANPANRTVQSVNRSWNDRSFGVGDPRTGNFRPDCDLLNPAANGECGPNSSQAFGNPVPSTTYDPDILSGWGKRGYNWEGSVGVQHEIVSNVSVDFGFFRRWYGNFLATDNRAVTAADFDTFSVVAPSDPRLPGGGGQTITGLVNVKPEKFGQTDNLLTFAENYGTQKENWQGVDLSVNSRLRGGIIAQGGISTGRRLTDSCDVRAKQPELNVAGNGLIAAQSYCRQVEPYLTQFKAIGAYTLPTIDVQLAATFQSIPGPVLQANVVYPNAVIQQSLGRPLSGNAATAQVNVITPSTEYGDRLNQLDLRFGKLFRFAGARTAFNVDVYNVFNSNAVLTENASYAAYRQPLNVLNPRVWKLSVNFDF